MAIFRNGKKVLKMYQNGEKIYEYEPIIRNINVAGQSNGGVATASSYYSAGGTSSYPPSNANDVNTTSRWQGKTAPTISSPQWLQITFSNKYLLNFINILFTATGIGNNFTLEYLSSDGSWEKITLVTGNTDISCSFNFDIIETIAIRINITQSGGGTGPKIANIEAMYI